MGSAEEEKKVEFKVGDKFIDDDNDIGVITRVDDHMYYYKWLIVNGVSQVPQTYVNLKTEIEDLGWKKLTKLEQLLY